MADRRKILPKLTTLHKSINPTHTHDARTKQAALLGRWADLPLDERTAARNYAATLLLAAAPDRYPTFVRSQIVQVGGPCVCVCVCSCFFLGWMGGRLVLSVLILTGLSHPPHTNSNRGTTTRHDTTRPTQTFAVLWKRGWGEEGPEGKLAFFGQIQTLAQQPDRVVRLSLYCPLSLSHTQDPTVPQAPLPQKTRGRHDTPTHTLSDKNKQQGAGLRLHPRAGGGVLLGQISRLGPAPGVSPTGLCGPSVPARKNMMILTERGNNNVPSSEEERRRGALMVALALLLQHRHTRPLKITASTRPSSWGWPCWGNHWRRRCRPPRPPRSTPRYKHARSLAPFLSYPSHTRPSKSNTKSSPRCHAHPSTHPRPQTLGRLQAAAALCVEILSWDFGAFDPLHEPLAAHSPFVSPPISWRDPLLKPGLVDAVLHAYARVRLFFV